MLGAQMLGDLTRVARFVERFLGEADRKAVDWAFRELCHHGRHRARIDAAGQENAEGYIADELLPNGFAEDSPKLCDFIVQTSMWPIALAGRQIRRPIAVNAMRAAGHYPGQGVRRRELADSLDDGLWRRDIFHSEVVIQSPGNDPTPQGRIGEH